MIGRLLARLVLVPLGMLAAALTTFAVAASLGLERLTAEATRAGGSDLDGWMRVVIVHWETAAGLIGALTVLPAALVVLVGEVARVRSLLYYVAGGGLAMAVVPVLMRYAADGRAMQAPASVWYVVATAGFAGGLVYWLIAGRSA